MDPSGQIGGEQDGQGGGVWLDEPEARGGRSKTIRHRTAVALAAMVCLAVVAVPVSLALTGSSAAGHRQAKGTVSGSNAGKSSPLAVASVLSALSAITDSGNFDFTYTLDSKAAPSTASTTAATAPPVCMPTANPVIHNGGSNPYAASVAGGASGTFQPNPGTTVTTLGRSCFYQSPVQQVAPTVTGSGVINVNPSAMVTTAVVGGSLTVGVRENATDYWEENGTPHETLAPPTSSTGGSSGPGSPLGTFAPLVEGTLGAREGPVAMISLASPSGYLDLYQSEVTAASSIGTSTVDGTAVTVYRIPVTPAQEAQVAGSPEETQTISAALSALQTVGYTGTTVEVSIDAEGYILQSESIANFSDGGTVDLTATFSNFGCAGTVLTPGQQGPGVPPPNCTSPVPPAPPKASSFTPTPSSSTTSIAVATSTTAPIATSTTAPSTSTTSSPPSVPASVWAHPRPATVPTTSTTSASVSSTPSG
jgi:hypothetical protein